MKLEFSKLNGLGNDFIFIDDLSDEIELSSAQVKALCDRHFGIGADGVILVKPPKDDRSLAYMHYINADGTLAQMCGNGVRCFAKYLVDRGFAHAADGVLVAGTMAGDRAISFTVDEADKMSTATVDMGEPIFAPEAIPASLEASSAFEGGPAAIMETELASPWGTFAFSCVSMGNPHAICFIEDWDALPNQLFSDSSSKGLRTLLIDEIGAFYESHDAFPERSNIEFAQIVPDGIDMRVYERGCGETLACGTGACATFVAACLTKRAEGNGTLHLLGGDLQISWDGAGSVFMTGPAEESFSGTIEV